MQATFRCLNLYTEYGCSGAFTKSVESHPCFRNAFCFNRGQPKGTKYKNTYEIYIWTSLEHNKQGDNNFSLVDIQKYLGYLSEVMPFEFCIEAKAKGENVVKVTVDDYRYIHNYILCCVRYLYEYPYNLALYDAIQLYESGECPGLNIIDCFNLVLATSDTSYSGEQVCLDHHCASKPMTGKEIRNILFVKERNNPTCIKVSGEFNPKVNFMQVGHIENHINTFYRRATVYKTNYETYLRKYV